MTAWSDEAARPCGRGAPRPAVTPAAAHHGTAPARDRLLAVAMVLSLLVAGLSSAVLVWPAAGDGAPPASAAKVDPGIDTAGAGPVAVIVQAVPEREAEARAAVAAADGVVLAELPFVHGFEVEVAGSLVGAVAASPAVRSVSADRRIVFEDMTYDETTVSSNFAKTSQATAAWAAGNLGAGVGVAVIDTGVSSMGDLDGRLAFGPDLSGEGSTVDTHGHGTVMAGIVAGDGADSALRPGGAFAGVAPRATVVPVKVAGRNGVVDVSTMLQAMHWVSAYRAQHNIRVMNLSWGTTSTQDPALDPLNYGVQRLWQEGVVVVVAAGNSGPQSGTVLKPGDDPVVLTVGAFDDKQNADPADDSIPSWSSRGPTAAGVAKPDILAPGRFITALRSHGSHIEASYPKALVSPSYIRGSGTSEAAAVTSGLVALLLAEHPALTPDQVKSVLKRSASALPTFAAAAQGGGRVRLDAARSLAAGDPGPAAWQSPTATGAGSIEGSRGGHNVETDCGPDGVTDLIQGEIDVRCEAWVAADWTGSKWTGEAWTGAEWTGSKWTGSKWTGSKWTDAVWTGAAWTGGGWSGESWQGGSAWTGSKWTGSKWTGSKWTGSKWTGSKWTGSKWTTAEYDEFTSFGYEDTLGTTAETVGETGFLNAFWGPRPGAGQRVAGEVAEDQRPASSGPRRAL